MSKSVGKIFAIGCGGLVMLFVLIMVAGQFLISPEMRAEMEKSAEEEYNARQSAVKAKADAFFASLSDLRSQLPVAGELKEQLATAPCVPAEPVFGGAPFMAVDIGWLQQFTDRGFVPAKPAPNPPPWYRDTYFRHIEAQAVPAKGMSRPDYETMLLNADNVKAVPYIAVIQPLRESWPALSKGGTSFRSGLFHGWLILVDGKTAKPIGQTEIAASNSQEIRSFQIGIRNQMILGDDAKAALEEDFTDHFWEAVNMAVARICRQEADADFASHEEFYVRPES